MKLESVEIQNFRCIEQLRLDFCDELGRIQGLLPIVGPNTSGKTTILDAISLCLTPNTEIGRPRPGLVLTPASIVRRGALQARVICTVFFSDEEVDAARELLRKVENPYRIPPPEANRVVVRWEFPDRQGKHRGGYSQFEPRNSWILFKPRAVTARSLHVPDVSPHDFRNHGGVFSFDQQRTGLGKRIPARQQALLSRGTDGGSDKGVDPDDSLWGGDYTRDARIILLNLATRAQAVQDREATEQEDYERLRELYASVCRPHRIRGLYNTEFGLDMEFEGPHGVYLFDGLSSGQEMILLLLLQFCTKHIHRSIVLIDELELHLHPLWQERLYQALPNLGIDNQILFTTHSTHLRDSLRGEFVHCTGDLDHAPAIKEGV